MAHILESPFLQLVIDPENASWSLASKQEHYPTVDAAQMQVWYRMGRGLFLALSWWKDSQWLPPQIVESPHGSLKQSGLTFQDDNGLRYILTFALSVQHPLMLWKITVRNDTQKTVLLQRLSMMEVKRYHPKGKPGFFSNGWQSWSYSGAYGQDDRFRRTRLGPFFSPLRVSRGTPQPRARGHFSSDMFAVFGDRISRTGLLVGFLSQKQNFGSVEARLSGETSILRLWANGDNAHLEPGLSFSSDWATLHFLDLDDPDPLAPYLEAVAREHTRVHPGNMLPDQNQISTSDIPTGWCSWYHYLSKVTAADVRQNLMAVSEFRQDLPIRLIQLDDGFEAQAGDWLHFNDRFPDGVASLAAEIRAAGFTPGIWLAPFIVHPRSRLAAVHPNWILRGPVNTPLYRNRAVNAGFIWNTFTNALDLTHPDALQYACDVVHTAAHRWGYPYLKLDFLYAGALSGRYHDPTRTRAQVLRMGLEALRQAVGPQVFLLGCGCPLGTAVGVVQAMRIGADVDHRWNPSHFGTEFVFKSEPDMPSTRNAIQNSLTRSPMHRRWWVNDPDCLLLSPDTDLALAEVHSLATVIALTGGSLLISDDLSKLPPERLRIAQQMLPVIGRRPRLLDWFDVATPTRLRLDLESGAGKWSLLALFNWTDTAQDRTLRISDYDLPSGIYHAREFWSGELAKIDDLGLSCQIAAHGVALFAVRPARVPQYLGGDLHCSQGLEVKDWSYSAELGTLKVLLERPGHAMGFVILSLPQSPTMVKLNGKPDRWETVGENYYRFPIVFDRSGLLEVNW